jgi:tRNA threonylcarbamoyladenosine modification (KEOPS) complex Cgi121 subunit
VVSKISNSNLTSDFKLLTIPSLHIQGFNLSNNLTKDRIDSLVKWSSTIENRIVQFFDGEKIVSVKQLEVGFARALRSVEQNKMIAKNVEVELALWVAGTRLIKTAFERVGISSKTKYLLVVSVNKDGSDIAKIPDNYSNEFQKIIQDNQEWNYKKPTNIDLISEVYEINLNPFEKELKMSDLENYVLQKIALLTVLM